MTDKPYDAGDKVHVETKKTKRQLETDAELNRLRFIMSDSKGRAFMHELLKEAHIFQPSFHADNERMTCFREGERNVGLKLLGKLQISFLDEYTLMLKEHQERTTK